MSQVLQGLAAVPGVFGCAVFDRNGQCTAHELSPPYEPVLLAHVIGLFSATFEIFDSADDDGPSRELVVNCESGILVVRPVGEQVVIVINQPTTNLAMLNVAINVVAAKLRSPMPLPSRSGSGSGLSWTSGSTGPVPVDAVGRSTVKQLLKSLQSFLGPAAKSVLKQEMLTLGMRPSTLTRGQGSDLVVALSQRIDNEEWRQSFLSEARQLFR